MRSLFGFLVNQIGKQNVVDPITKDDPILKIIDFFTSNASKIVNFGPNNLNTLSESSIS